MFTCPWAALAFLLLALVAGCQSAAKGGGGAPAGGGGTSAGVVESPAVVYDASIPPEPLRLAQREEILKVAKEHCPTGRSIWFLYVHSNREYEGKLSHDTSVYYSPDQQTARVRRGSYIGVGAWLSILLGTDSPHRYCQVSPPSEPFGEELATPQGLLLPFPAPEGFSDDEIIEIVDFVCSLKKEHDTFNYSEWRESAIGTFERGATTVELPYLYDLQAGESIQQINRYGDAVDIGIGSWEGPLSAHCKVLRCIKTESGYKVVDSYYIYA